VAEDRFSRELIVQIVAGLVVAALGYPRRTFLLLFAIDVARALPSPSWGGVGGGGSCSDRCIL